MAKLFRGNQRHPVTEFTRDHGPALLAGIGAGAVLAVVVGRGLASRRRLMDRAGGATRTAAGRMTRRARDLRNRARGTLLETRNRLRADTPSDEQLQARVRSQLGHHADHASRIETVVSDGVVTLRGGILAGEVGDVMNGVRGVRGVREVKNELSVFEDAEELVRS